MDNNDSTIWSSSSAPTRRMNSATHGSELASNNLPIPRGTTPDGLNNDALDNTKYIDPPSYEEAIKGMEGGTDNYISHPPHIRYDTPRVEDSAYFLNYPEHGQFGSSEPIFYSHEYTVTDTEPEEKRSNLSKIFGTILSAILIVIIIKTLSAS